MESNFVAESHEAFSSAFMGSVISFLAAVPEILCLRKFLKRNIRRGLVASMMHFDAR